MIENSVFMVFIIYHLYMLSHWVASNVWACNRLRMRATYYLVAQKLTCDIALN